MILRCTAKLLKLVGEKPVADAGDGPEWYGNLIWIERRKCLLFTHAETLFSFMVSDVRRADIAPLEPFVLGRIRHELASEGLRPEPFGVGRDADMVVARTNDRGVLGSMNDLAFQCQHAAASDGGLEHLDMREWNRQLHRTPMGARKYGFPIDLARELDRTGKAGRSS